MDLDAMRHAARRGIAGDNGPITIDATAARGALRPPRLVSIDVYRGFVMLLMAAEALRTCDVAAALPTSSTSGQLWAFVCAQQTHAAWTGLSLHDLIQPSFSFLVGLVLPMSIAARLRNGHTRADLLRHAVWRSLVLVLIGVGLRQWRARSLDITFEDTLAQIGLGYTFLFALAWTRRRTQVASLVVLLVGVWCAYVAYPLPGPSFDFAGVGVSQTFLDAHPLSGIAGHFQMNSNLGWALDRTWLNLFPRTHPFAFHPQGYVTFNVLPTLATMLLGMLVYPLLASARPGRARLATLALLGVVCIAAGLAWSASGLCPIVKRLWTPSFVLVSGGLCVLMLTGFSLIADTGRGKAWTWVLGVIGANSLLAYLLAELASDPIARRLVRYLGHAPFSLAGTAYEPLVVGALVVALEWTLLYVLFRRRLFLRV